MEVYRRHEETRNEFGMFCDGEKKREKAILLCFYSSMIFFLYDSVDGVYLYKKKKPGLIVKQKNN